MLHGAIDATRKDTEELRQQAIALEQEHNQLEQYEKEKGTIQEVIRIAMERLGLVKPDSVVIQPE
jgi:cell division protein FtsB